LQPQPLALCTYADKKASDDGPRYLALNACNRLWLLEKLLPAKFAKIKSRRRLLQTTFSVFPDIFYPPNFGYFEEMDFFNTHA